MYTKNEQRNIEVIAPAELGTYLAMFIMSVRKEIGGQMEDYEPGSLLSTFNSIGRYLRGVGYTEDLTLSPSFQHCRDVLASKRKLLKSEGKGNLPNKAQAFTAADIKVLFNKNVLGTSECLSSKCTVSSALFT